MTAPLRNAIRKYFWLLLLPALVAGCGTTQVKKLEKGNLKFMYLPKTSLGTEVEKYPFKHPIKISRREVMNHLLSLRYEELSLTGKKRYVFDERDVMELSGLLTKAMNHVGPDKIVYFEIDTLHGTTIGKTFAIGGKVNWQILTVRGEDYASSSFPGWRASTWRLLPKKGQRYWVTNNILGKNVKENWVVADLKLPDKAKRWDRLSGRVESRKARRPPEGESAAPNVQPRPPGKNPELEEKLEFLKELHRKNLIDDREYQLKRKELLDNYF